MIDLNLNSDAPEVEGAGGVGYTFDVDIRVAYVNLRGPLSVVVCGDWRREDEGRARWVCSELGAQSRPPDIVDGGAVRESLSITAEKDEKVVSGLMKRNDDIYVRVSRYLGKKLKAPKNHPTYWDLLASFAD